MGMGTGVGAVRGPCRRGFRLQAVDLLLPSENGLQTVLELVGRPIRFFLLRFKNFIQHEAGKPLLHFHLEGGGVVRLILLAHLHTYAFDLVDEGAEVGTKGIAASDEGQFPKGVVEGPSEWRRGAEYFGGGGFQRRALRAHGARIIPKTVHLDSARTLRRARFSAARLGAEV
uniref:Uncharacterized protein n=1 Tax=Globodera rostochiensis TaxID=31243 RepID=A0A914GUZ8_GLORO